MSSTAEEQAEVDAQRSDVGTGLAIDPEHGKVALGIELEQLALIDGAHAQATLDGRHQRRALEQRSRQGLDGLSHFLLE